MASNGLPFKLALAAVKTEPAAARPRRYARVQRLYAGSAEVIKGLMGRAIGH
jgi:hypothetical protein